MRVSKAASPCLTTNRTFLLGDPERAGDARSGTSRVEATRGPGNTGADPTPTSPQTRLYSSYESPELLHASRLNVTVSARAINASERGGIPRRGSNEERGKKTRKEKNNNATKKRKKERAERERRAMSVYSVKIR